MVLVAQNYSSMLEGQFNGAGTHTLCMVAAFGLLSPVGAPAAAVLYHLCPMVKPCPPSLPAGAAQVATVAWATYETLLGVSHATAKSIHACLQTAALAIGLVGFTAMCAQMHLIYPPSAALVPASSPCSHWSRI